MVKTLEGNRYALCEKLFLFPFCCSYQMHCYLAGCFSLISCRHYLEIAKSGSFSGAARQLYLSPQALMKQISKVEDEIGFQIFNRTSRGVTMTAAGEKLISYLKQRQEDQYAMLERCRAASTSQGLLRLAL